MKRDMDLCRKILLAIESVDDSKKPAEKNGWVDSLAKEFNTDRDQIQRYNWLLFDAGLIGGYTIAVPNYSHPQVESSHLTWAGHEFLDAARNEGVWKKSMSAVLTATGGASLEMLKRALLTYGQQALDTVIKAATGG